MEELVQRKDGLPLLIGLCGYAGSGKTTAAEILQKDLGYLSRHPLQDMKEMLAAFYRYRKVSEEDILRKVDLAAFYRYRKVSEEDILRKVDGDLKRVPCPYLKGKTPEYAQITLGSEWGRDCISPELWISGWSSTADGDAGETNQSVRLPNEADFIEDAGGILIELRRSTAGPKIRYGDFGRMLFGTGISSLKSLAQHRSDRVHLLRPNYVIWNNGTPSMLAANLHKVLEDARDMGLTDRKAPQEFGHAY